MVKTPCSRCLRLIGVLTLGVAALAVPACGSDEGADPPADVVVGTEEAGPEEPGAAEVPREYDAADLRPEASALVDLTDPQDAALVALWSNYFVTEESIVGQRQVWAEEIAAEVATCLTSNGFDPGPGRTVTEAARALVTSRFTTTPSDEEDAPPDEAADLAATWDSDPKAETCVATIDARAGYLDAGAYGERRQAGIEAGTWATDGQLRNELDGLLQEHCPDAIDAIDANDGTCARLGEFLAEAAPGMKREITANWSVLSG